jgi:hypothetical protein
MKESPRNHRPSPAGSDGQTDSLKSIPRTVALSPIPR